jgi:hypothetical protein
MEASRQPEQKRTIDVSELPDAAIRAVELLVSQLRSPPPSRNQPGRIGSYGSYEEWSKALREWAENHRPLDTPADYSRESIYSERI